MYSKSLEFIQSYYGLNIQDSTKQRQSKIIWVQLEPTVRPAFLPCVIWGQNADKSIGLCLFGVLTASVAYYLVFHSSSLHLLQ